MASSTKQFFVFLLLTALSSSLHTHARDSQFFNKVSAVPSTTTATVDPDAEQPKFLPENDNSYGLYAHASSQLSPSTTTAAALPLHNHKHLPKNYNPVAYVTLPEDTNSFGSNYYNNGGSSRHSDARFRGGAAYNGGGFRPQGMSDTRFLESGRYFYDVNREKYSSNHPYQNLRDDQTRNEFYNKNFNGDSENAYEFNGEGYQSRDEFEDEVNNLP